MADGDTLKFGAADTCGDTRCEAATSNAVLAPERHVLIREAFFLEWATVAWMIIECGVAIAAGVVAGSLTLMAFGLDSVIELASAGVLIWRLSIELRRGQVFSEEAEHIAGKVGGALLFTLAAYIVAGAGWSLGTRQGRRFRWRG